MAPGRADRRLRVRPRLDRLLLALRTSLSYHAGGRGVVPTTPDNRKPYAPETLADGVREVLDSRDGRMQSGERVQGFLATPSS